MSNHVQPKTIKANKPLVINVKKGGELHVNACGLKDVNRVISTNAMPDGSVDVTLLANPSDVWRFTSHKTLDLGECFGTKQMTTDVKYFHVTPQGEFKLINRLTNEQYCRDEFFVRVNTATSLTQDLYKSVIGYLTNNQNLVHVSNNEPFNIRNMSKETETHFVGHCFIYHLTWGVTDNKFHIKKVEQLSLADARALVNRGIATDECLVRQHFSYSNTILVNFNKEIEGPSMAYLMNAITDLTKAEVKLNKNRFNLNVNLDWTINNAKEIKADDQSSIPVLPLQTSTEESQPEVAEG